MNKKRGFTVFVFSLFMLIFNACSVDVSWNANLFEEINKDGRLKITYCSTKNEDAITFTESYLKGAALKAEDMPGMSDPRVSGMKLGYRLVGWMIKDDDKKNVNIFSATQASVEENPYILSKVVLSCNDIQLYAVWTERTDIPYKVNYYLENIDNEEYTLEETVTYYGKTDETIGIDIPDKEHFTYNGNISDDDVIITPDGLATAKVYYDRNEYTITFTTEKGTVTNNSPSDPSNIVSGKYGASVNLNLNSFYANSPDEMFYGWQEGEQDVFFTDVSQAESSCLAQSDVPLIFTKDINYYPVWGPFVYTVSLYDQFEKPLSGTVSSPDFTNNTCTWINTNSSSLEIPTPENSNTNLSFEGWYLNSSDCISEGKLNETDGKITLNINSSISNRNIKLYAKWSYNNVYVDPAQGNDTNTGATPDKPVKTITEAVKYTINNTGAISLLSPITKAEDVTALSSISKTCASILNRYTVKSVYDFPVIKLSEDMTDEQILQDVTIDGGAGDINVISYADNTVSSVPGKVSSVPLIYNTKKMIIGKNVTLQNNLNTYSQGGAIWNTGSLTMKGESDKLIKIYNNYSTQGGAIFQSSPGTITAEYLEIGKDNSGNYALQGGGIATVGGSVNLTNCNITYNRSKTNGGGISATSDSSSTAQIITMNNCSISNNNSYNKNKNEGTGGGMYLTNYTLTTENCIISNNKVGSYGGGITFSSGASGSVSATTIKNNSAKYGGGISATTYVTTPIDIKNDTYIIDNVLLEGGCGSGIYMTQAAINFDGGTLKKESSSDTLYFTKAKSTINVNFSYASDTSIGNLVFDKYEEDICVFTDKTGGGNNFTSLFTIEPDSEGKSWKLNKADNNKYLLECVSVSTDSGIINPLETQLTCSKSESSVNPKHYTFTNQNNENVTTEITSISLTVTYMGVTVPEQEYTYSWNSSDNKLTFSDALYSGTYDIVLIVVYQGRLFTFTDTYIKG